MTVLTQAGLTLASLAPKLVGALDLGRIKPFPKSSKYAARKLDKAFDKHVDDIKPGANVGYSVSENYPKADNRMDGYLEGLNNPNTYASSSVAGQKPGVSINPNADRVYYAHELGHLASQQSDVGYFVNKLRQNPNLARAMGASLMTVTALAHVEEGDNDLDTSVHLLL